MWQPPGSGSISALSGRSRCAAIPSGSASTVRGPLATMESVTFPVETFTSAEQERLARHFTNLDRPFFGLVNLPETVKGALFARYSR